MKKRSPIAAGRAVPAFLLAVLLILSCIPCAAADAVWRISDDTRIFWASTPDSQRTDDALMAQIRLFSSELTAKVTGQSPGIYYGSAEYAGEHDILLLLDRMLELAK